MDQDRNDGHVNMTESSFKRRLRAFRSRFHPRNPRPNDKVTAGSNPASKAPVIASNQGSEINTLTKTLWEQAYDEVEKLEEYKGFAVKYQKILLRQDPNADLPSIAARKEGMRKLIEQQRKVLEDGRWGFELFGRAFKAADIVSNIIRGFIKIESTVGGILRGTGEPHAAMIVAGVAVLLPLITNPAAQDKYALELLQQIFDSTQRYYLYEEILNKAEKNQSIEAEVLRRQMQHKFVSLYVEILKAQICLACKFARSSFLQYGRDVLKFDAWFTMQRDIEQKGEDLSADFQALQLSIIEQISSDHSRQDKLQSNLDETNSKFLQIFSSPLDFRGTTEQVDSCVKGTNEWIARDARFITWRDNSDSTVLLVKAGAGHGKSVLLKYLLETEMATSFGSLTCFFFFHGESDLGRSDLECINALIYQILELQPNLVGAVRQAFPATNMNTKHHFGTLCKIAEFCMNEYDGQIILVIDGLDECGELETKAVSPPNKRRTWFFDWLASIIGNKKLQVKLFCSIRTGADTAFYTSDKFHQLPKTLIDLNDEEHHIQTDIETYIRWKVARPSITATKQEELTAMLLDIQKSSGSYLWLKLVFEILPRPAFETMSVSDFKNYLLKDDMDRVDRQFSELLPIGYMQRTVAKIIFSILLGARRPLTTNELTDAVQSATGKFYQLGRPDVLADYCGAFIEIKTVTVTIPSWKSPSKEIVTFFHDRARTYLLSLPRTMTPIDVNKVSSHPDQSMNQETSEAITESTAKLLSKGFLHSFDAQETDQYMLNLCVQYITEESFINRLDENTKHKTAYSTVKSWISMYLDDRAFMGYAAVHWINHLPLDETDVQEQQKITDSFSRLLDVSSAAFRVWFACAWQIWAQDMPMEDFFREYVTAFVTDHLAPDEKVMKQFDVSDGGIGDAWLWWTIESDSSGLSDFKTLMTKCSPDYDDAQPSRTPLLAITSMTPSAYG